MIPQIIGKAFYKYNGSNPYTITTMKIIAPFKFWLKAVEIFFLQIPCFLLSVYFAGIASMFLSAMHGELTLLDKIIFFSIFIFTNTLLFANYCDWGKSSNKKQKRFLPSQAGLIEGLKMTFVALIANYFISLLLSLLLPESYLNQLEDSGIKFHFSLRGAIILSALWLYVASYLLYCISLLRFIKK